MAEERKPESIHCPHWLDDLRDGYCELRDGRCDATACPLEEGEGEGDE